MAIEDLLPADTPREMLPAWLGCMSWAISVPEIIAAFREETGERWQPGATPIERMIDASTGCDRAFIEAFIRWANVNIWGPIKLPEGADVDGGQVDLPGTVEPSKP